MIDLQRLPRGLSLLLQLSNALFLGATGHHLHFEQAFLSGLGYLLGLSLLHSGIVLGQGLSLAGLQNKLLALAICNDFVSCECFHSLRRESFSHILLKFLSARLREEFVVKHSEVNGVEGWEGGEITHVDLIGSFLSGGRFGRHPYLTTNFLILNLFILITNNPLSPTQTSGCGKDNSMNLNF